jgi:hypothetical protein
MTKKALGTWAKHIDGVDLDKLYVIEMRSDRISGWIIADLSTFEGRNAHYTEKWLAWDNAAEPTAYLNAMMNDDERRSPGVEYVVVKAGSLLGWNYNWSAKAGIYRRVAPKESSTTLAAYVKATRAMNVDYLKTLADDAKRAQKEYADECKMVSMFERQAKAALKKDAR